MTYDPENWLPSMFRELKRYVEDGIDNHLMENTTPVGLQVYDVVFDFPADSEADFQTKLNKTVIHFIIDDIDNKTLGLGDSIVKEYWQGEGEDERYYEDQAQEHIVNFDVGIWSSDHSGGVTARLNAYQILTMLFQGPIAQRKFLSFTDGIEIRSFRGGRFATDRINDIVIYRTIDTDLVLRAYSKQTIEPAGMPVESIEVTQNIHVDGEVIVDTEYVEEP